MSGEDRITFDEAMEHLRKQRRRTSLLLGNGFSMAYDPEIFSYTALANFVANLKDPVLTGLFRAINTTNFEQLMQYLSVTIQILKAFDASPKLIGNIEAANLHLKESLVDAIQALHPEHVFKVSEEKSLKCAEFLRKFLETDGSIFTTNYDLLLYWVLMRNEVPGAVDGFGRELLNEDEVIHGEDQEWSDLVWGPNTSRQRVFYVHGALPLFDDGVEILKEQYSEKGFLLENIQKRIDAGQYPVFVTAGNGREKMAHISHNKYLTDCYENLSIVSGSLVVFGFNFGDYDTHIIDAINKASSSRRGPGDKLWSIYIGVYNDADYQHVLKIKHKFKCKVNIFDSKTANIWGQ